MRVVSVVYWLGVALSSLLMFPIAVLVFVVTKPFDPRGIVLHGWTSFWASLYTWFNPLWSVTVRGREHMPSDTPCVLVANHLSLVDILVVFRLFKHFKWVSKQENFAIPLIGWNMRLNHYIPLLRGDRQSVADMFARCEATLRSGSSVFMFPEGTRSRDGRLKPFKTGAFDLALRAGVPVVPIAIVGSQTALPKKGFTIRRARISVKVLPPVSVAEMTDLSAEELTTYVHTLLRPHVEL